MVIYCPYSYPAHSVAPKNKVLKVSHNNYNVENQKAPRSIFIVYEFDRKVVNLIYLFCKVHNQRVGYKVALNQNKFSLKVISFSLRTKKLRVAQLGKNCHLHQPRRRPRCLRRVITSLSNFVNMWNVF